MTRSLLRGLLCALAVLPITLRLPAQTPGIPDLTSQIDSGASKIPEDCKTAEKAPDAIAALLQALQSNPSAEGYDKLGTLYGRTGNFKCAIAAFQAALVLNPGALQSHYNLALALLETHDPQHAENELRNLLRRQQDLSLPQKAMTHNALGLARQDLGDPSGAESEFKSALTVSPGFPLASYDLARLLSSQKKYKAAIECLKNGLANSPSVQLALQMKEALAIADSQAGEYSDSIPILQELIAARANVAPSDTEELHFDLATAYAHNQQYPEAVKEYKEVLRLNPNRVEAELMLARALLNMSAVEDAMPYLEDYTRRNPSDAEAQEALGDALKDSEHLGEAVEALERAIKLNPSSYKAHYDLGVVLHRLGRDDEAIQELQAAIKWKPDGKEARYQLARILAKKKSGDAATQQFSAFEQLKQEDDRETKANFFSNQGNEFLQQGRAKEAVEAFQKAIALEPKDARLHYNFALALGKLNDPVGEEHELREAAALDARLQVHNQLGSAFMQQGRFAEAERQFKSALESDPQSAEALNNLGTLYGRQGKNKEAEALFRQALASDPQNVQALVNLGLTLAAERNYPEAEQQFLSALRLDEKNANALTALGMLQGKNGRNQESVETFRKLTGLYPLSAEAHLNLGIALGDVYDLQGALAEFSEAIHLAPRLAQAHYNRGRVLYALGRMEEAWHELDAAVHLASNYADALFLLGVIEHDSDRAADLFQKVVNLQPGNSEARFYLGRHLFEQGRKQEAIIQWKKAVETDPENLSALSVLARTLTQLKSPDAPKYSAQLRALQERRQLTDRVQQLNNFALQAADDNNWPAAVSQLQQAIDLCDQCPQVGTLRKNLGIIYARKGDVENAKQQLQLAVKLLPAGSDSTVIADLLRRLNGPETVSGQNH